MHLSDLAVTIIAETIALWVRWRGWRAASARAAHRRRRLVWIAANRVALPMKDAGTTLSIHRISCSRAALHLHLH